MVAAHVEYLERLSKECVVLLAGRTQTTDEATFGIVVLQADSESTAREIMDNDPAVLNDIMNAQLFPYQSAVVSPGILNC